MTISSQIIKSLLFGFLLAGTVIQIHGRIQNTNEGVNKWFSEDDATFLTPPNRRLQNQQDRGLPQTCADDCNCPSTYQPFCGSNGVTYSSRCNLDCARNCNQGLRVSFEGVCPVPYNGRGQKVHQHVKEQEYRRRPTTALPPSTLPPRRWAVQQPRSGPTTTRRPFFPPSTVRAPIQPGVNRKPDARCINCVCGYSYGPVCASDGLIYDNMCLFECAQRTCNSYLTREAPTNCWEWSKEDESTVAPSTPRPRTIPPRYGSQYGK